MSKESLQQLLSWFLGPTLLGIAIAVLPDIWLFNAALFLVPVWIYRRSRRRDRSWPPWLGLARFAIVLLIVVAADYAPVKYMDRTVNPPSFRFSSGPKTTQVFGQGMLMLFPAGTTESSLALPAGPISRRDLVAAIERTTGLHAFAPHCGNDRPTVLWGGRPMFISFQAARGD